MSATTTETSTSLQIKPSDKRSKSGRAMKETTSRLLALTKWTRRDLEDYLCACIAARWYFNFACHVGPRASHIVTHDSCAALYDQLKAQATGE